MVHSSEDMQAVHEASLSLVSCVQSGTVRSVGVCTADVEIADRQLSPSPVLECTTRLSNQYISGAGQHLALAPKYCHVAASHFLLQG
jgi:hypothetical protein